MVLNIRVVIAFGKENGVLLRCSQCSIFDVYKVYMGMITVKIHQALHL